MAWRIPSVWHEAADDRRRAPENSGVLAAQLRLRRATEKTLAEIARDARAGLLETVGIESRLSTDGERCSLILELADEVDRALISRAIDMENVESWLDANGKVNVAVNPWLTTKDVDQIVLSTIKVVHVLLGLHAAAPVPQTLRQKLLASLAEILRLQKNARQAKN